MNKIISFTTDNDDHLTDMNSSIMKLINKSNNKNKQNHIHTSIYSEPKILQLEVKLIYVQNV